MKLQERVNVKEAGGWHGDFDVACPNGHHMARWASLLNLRLLAKVFAKIQEVSRKPLDLLSMIIRVKWPTDPFFSIAGGAIMPCEFLVVEQQLVEANPRYRLGWICNQFRPSQDMLCCINSVLTGYSSYISLR